MRKLGWAIGGAAIVLGGVGALAVGPLAPALVDVLTDNQPVWRLGRLTVSGVSGGHLGDLRLARAELADQAGVYAVARDVALTWSPFELLFGRAAITDLRFGAIDVQRQPTLSPPMPDGGSFDVDLKAWRVDNLTLAEPVIGLAAEIAADGAVSMRAGAVTGLTLNARRLDANTDRVALHYDAGARGLGTAEVVGAQDGVLARVLGVDAPVTLRATSRGEPRAASGEITARVGDASALSGAWRWQGESLSVEATADLSALPASRNLAARIGETVQASMALEGEALSVRAVAPDISATLQGRVRGAALDGDAQWALEGKALQRIAPDLGLTQGAVRAEGVLRQDGASWSVSGDAVIAATRRDGLQVRARGPLNARVESGVVRGEIDWALSADGAASAGWIDQGNLSAELLVSSAGRLFAPRVRIVSPALDLAAQSDGRRWGGAWRIVDLQRVAPGFSGAAAGRFNLENGQFSAAGDGERVTAPPPLRQMLGARPRFSVQGLLARDGVIIESARLDGAQARFGARGAIAGELNLALEASVRGPLPIGGVELTGVVDAIGTLSGPLSAPQANLTAQTGVLDTPIGALRNGKATLSVSARGGALAGALELTGASDFGAVSVSAPLQIDRGAISAPSLSARLGALAFEGAVRLEAEGPVVEGRLAGRGDGFGVDAPLSGSVALVRDSITVRADIGEGRIGPMQMQSGAFSLEGPLAAMAARARVQGRASGQAVMLQTDARIASSADGVRAVLDVQGAVAGAAIRSTKPFEFAQTRIDMRLRGALGVDAGELMLDAATGAGGLRGDATARALPLAPLLALLGERGGGVADGRIAVRSQGAGLAGEADMTVANLTLSRRAPDPLTVSLRASLAPDRLQGVLNATSAGGLQAQAQLDAPMETRASPMRIALARNTEARVRWQASGQAQAVWAAFGPLDQRLTGALNGAGELRISAQRIAGSGDLSLRDGAFEDRTLGVSLRAVSANVQFDERGAVLDQFDARDAQGGRVTASGRAEGLNSGNLSVQLSNATLISRPDVQAKASGPLSLSWTPEGVLLSGALALDEAQANPPRPARVQALLPVREINRPVALTPPVSPQSCALPVRLDLAITAPAWVFVRGRGLQSEWALDVKVRGRAEAPLLQGEARLLRGDFRLAGRPFEVDRGVVRFSGRVDDALLDIEASRTTTDLTAMLKITGPLSKPEIVLASTPALPQEEVLPQVVFGRAGADLSPIEAAQIAASLAELSGQAAFDLAGLARALVQLDRLDLRQAGDGFLLAGGKYLTRDVYLELSRTSLGQSEAQIEWRVRPQLFLVSRFEAQGDARVSLRWRTED